MYSCAFATAALVLLWGGIAAADWATASTKVETADGTLTIRGIDGSARHTHGGPAAFIGNAQFEISNRSAKARTLEAKTVEFLTGKSCEKPPATVSANPTPAGLFADDGKQRESTKSITVPANTTVTVSAGFAPAVEAYYVWCDRFAIRVGFSVDGAAALLSAVAETNVTRVEPRRPRE